MSSDNLSEVGGNGGIPNCFQILLVKIPDLEIIASPVRGDYIAIGFYHYVGKNIHASLSNKCFRMQVILLELLKRGKFGKKLKREIPVSILYFGHFHP